jgi:SpoVK/Ycf46/Vps4 family AAA+-type ATPase
MQFQQELEIALRARTSFVYVVSFEERRILQDLKALCERRKTALYTWDQADHFRLVVGKGETPDAREPLAALEAIERIEGRALFLLPDFHHCWQEQPRIVRKLRNLAHALKYTHKTIVVVSPSRRIPEDLEDDATTLDYEAPDVPELRQILAGLLAAPGTKVDLSPEDMEKLVRSALGLSSNQAQRVFAKAIVSEGVLNREDIALVIREKRKIVRGSGALDVYEARASIADVGGLEVLKQWLRMRESAFGDAARDYGLPEPKGIALIGIPGTGKSLTAKMIGSLWRLPLLRLDLGAVFGRFVGESEENCRRALRLAETIAPCVLWIDELEKGIGTGDSDGGTSMRVLATLLSWMQEKTKPVFVVATANDVGRLPPELLRRGRFDEIFFLDLPTKSERAEIFSVHIAKRGRKPSSFDVERLATASAGYVGAEIEQAIIDAMYRAFNDPDRPRREFGTEDILKAVDHVIPLSRSQRENITFLREWLREGRAQSASFQEASEAGKTFVPVS